MRPYFVPLDGEAGTCQLHLLTVVVCAGSGFAGWQMALPEISCSFHPGFLGSLGIIHAFFQKICIKHLRCAKVCAGPVMSQSDLVPGPLGAGIVFQDMSVTVFNQSLQGRPWVVSNHLRLQTNL